MDFQHLSDIHTGRHAKRVQHNIQRTAVRQKRHIFYWKHTGNHTFVSVTAGHFITYRDLTFLSNVNAHRLVYARRKLISVFPCEYLGIHNDSVLSVRNFKRSITYFTGFFTENGTEQTLLCGKLGLTLRSYLSYQDISRTYLGTNTDDTSFIQVFQGVITYAGNVSCDLFRSQLSITGFRLIFFYMDRCVNIVLY